MFGCTAQYFPEITLKNKGPSLLSVIELKMSIFKYFHLFSTKIQRGGQTYA